MKPHPITTRDRSGVVTVEMAILMPVIIVIMFGLIELCRIETIRSSADNAAYEGARAALVPGATASQAESAALDVTDAVGISGATVTVVPSVLQPETEVVEVAVTVPLAQNSIGLRLMLTTRDLVRRCSLTRSFTNQ